MEKIYYIYMHKNKINGKVYIGQTCQDPPSKRWKNGNGYKDSPKFYNAIQKYGWNNFEHIILECGSDSFWADEREIYWIGFYDSFDNDEKGYNMTPGGSNYISKLWADEKYREKMRDNFKISRKKSWSDKEFAEARLKSLLDGLHKSWENPEWRANRILNIQGDKNPNSKSVRNIETGKVFKTIKEASVWCGLKSVSGIGQCCNGTRKFSGKHPETGEPLHWTYADNKEENDEQILKRTKSRVKQQVVCLNDNIVFDSMSEAARWCNLKDSGKSIKACCVGKQKTAGFRPITKERCTWMFFKEVTL